MDITIILTYNLTNPKDNMGLPTYCRELLKKHQDIGKTKIINIELKKQKKPPKKEKFYEHNIITFYAPVCYKDTDENTRIQITEYMKKIQKNNKIKKIIYPDFIFEIYINEEFLKKNNIIKTMFIHLLNRGLLDKATRYEDTKKNIQYLKQLIINSQKEYKTVKTSDEFICNSEFTKEDLMKHYAEAIKDKRVYVTLLGVNKEIFNYSPQLSKPSWLFFGRLDIQKGLFFILKDMEKNAFKYKENPLILAGGFGGLRRYFEFMERQGLVVMRGNLQKDELIEGMRKVKYCVFPSIYEPWCLALTEAMAMGKICIIHSADSGMREQIIHGENGFIIDFEKDSIIEYIEKLEKSNINFEKIAKRARNSARDFNEHYKEIKKHL